jgi:hypothetical protein
MHEPKHVAVKPYKIKSVVVNDNCCPWVCKLKLLFLGLYQVLKVTNGITFVVVSVCRWVGIAYDLTWRRISSFSSIMPE